MTNEIKPSMLEIHENALKSVDKAYHDFLLIYRKNAKCVYGFVEGKDDPCFYRNLIEKELHQDWSIKLISSGNRNKVLQSYKSFNWNIYDKKRICFFIDRDLHDFLSTTTEVDSNIYVTDGYSIENSILEDRLLNNVLTDIYQISLLCPEDEHTIKEIVKENEQIFFESIKLLMGQIILWRRARKTAHLSNLKLEHLFKFIDEKCQPIEPGLFLEVASTQIGCSLDNEEDILNATNEFIDHSNSHQMIRGKYAMWFFIAQCETISKSITKLSLKFSKPPNKRISLGLNNAIVIIAPRAHTPESLKKFIQENYISFISNISSQNL